MSVVIDLIQHDDYPVYDDSYEKRLETFKTCSIIADKEKEDWALYGFQWMDELQSIKCQYCFVTIKGGNMKNSNDEEFHKIIDHIKLNPICKFIAPFIQKSAHPKYIEIEERRQSFNQLMTNWTQGIEWTKQELGYQGLCCISTEGSTPEILCYHCNQSLNPTIDCEATIGMSQEAREDFICEWMIEHFNNSPFCAYTIRTYGVDYLENVLRSIQARRDAEFTVASDEEESDHETPIQEIKDHIDQRYYLMPDVDQSIPDKILKTQIPEEEKIKYFEDKLKCKLCFQNESSVLFLPCRHLSSCTECHDKIKKECHMCRQIIDKKINVFW